MPEIITVGPDLGKNVFKVRGADGTGWAILRKKLWQTQALKFFGQHSTKYQNLSVDSTRCHCAPASARGCRVFSASALS